MPADWACSAAQEEEGEGGEGESARFQLEVGELGWFETQTAAREAGTRCTLQRRAGRAADQNVCFPSHLTGTITANKNNTGLCPGGNTQKH